MKTAIICHSEHHGNTRKLADAIAGKFGAVVIDASKASEHDLSEYELIGLASGIYAFRFHPEVQSAAENLPKGKRVFLIHTCAMPKDSYEKPVIAAIEKCGCEFVGSFSCQGFNTFGPFKLIGGTSKGKPDESDINAALCFFEGLV